MAMMKVRVQDKNSSLVVHFDLDPQNSRYQNLKIEDLNDTEEPLIQDIYFDYATITITSDNSDENQTSVSNFDFDKKQEIITYVQNETPVKLTSHKNVAEKITASQPVKAPTALDELDKLLESNTEKITNADINNLLHNSENKLTNVVTAKITATKPIKGSTVTPKTPVEELDEFLGSNAEQTTDADIDSLLHENKNKSTIATKSADELTTELNNFLKNDVDETPPPNAILLTIKLPQLKNKMSSHIVVDGQSYDALMVSAKRVNNAWIASEIWGTPLRQEYTQELPSKRVLLNAHLTTLQSSLAKLVDITNPADWHVSVYTKKDDMLEKTEAFNLTRPLNFQSENKNQFTLKVDDKYSIQTQSSLPASNLKVAADKVKTYKLIPITSRKSFSPFRKLFEKPGISALDFDNYKEITLQAVDFTNDKNPDLLVVQGHLKTGMVRSEANTFLSKFYENFQFECLYDGKKYKFIFDKAKKTALLHNLDGKGQDIQFDFINYTPKVAREPEMPASMTSEQLAQEKTTTTENKGTVYVGMPTVSARKPIPTNFKITSDEIIAQDIHKLVQSLSPEPLIQSSDPLNDDIVYVITPRNEAPERNQIDSFKQIQLTLTSDSKFKSAVGIFNQTSAHKNFSEKEFDALLKTQLLDHTRIVKKSPDGKSSAFDNCNLVKVKGQDVYKVTIDISNTNPFGRVPQRRDTQYFALDDSSPSTSDTTTEIPDTTSEAFPIFVDAQTYQPKTEFEKPVKAEKSNPDKNITNEAAVTPLTDPAVASTARSNTNTNVTSPLSNVVTSNISTSPLIAPNTAPKAKKGIRAQIDRFLHRKSPQTSKTGLTANQAVSAAMDLNNKMKVLTQQIKNSTMHAFDVNKVEKDFETQIQKLALEWNNLIIQCERLNAHKEVDQKLSILNSSLEKMYSAFDDFYILHSQQIEQSFAKNNNELDLSIEIDSVMPTQLASTTEHPLQDFTEIMAELNDDLKPESNYMTFTQIQKTWTSSNSNDVQDNDSPATDKIPLENINAQTNSDVDNIQAPPPPPPADNQPQLPLKMGILARVARHFREGTPTYQSKHRGKKVEIGALLHEHMSSEQRKLYRKNYPDVSTRQSDLVKHDIIYQSLINLENVYKSASSKTHADLLENLKQSDTQHILARAMEHENQTIDDLYDARAALDETIDNRTGYRKFKATELRKELDDIIQLAETRREKIDEVQKALSQPAVAESVYGNLHDNIPAAGAGNINLKVGSYLLTVEEYNNVRDRLKDTHLVNENVNSAIVDNDQSPILSDNPFIAHREAVPALLANTDHVVCTVLTDKVIATKDGSNVYHGGVISRAAHAVLVEKTADVVKVKNKPAHDIFLRNEMLLLQAVAVVKEFKHSDIKNPVLVSIDPALSEILYKVTRAYNYDFENRTLFQCPANMRIQKWEEKVVGNEKKPNMETLTVSSVRQWLKQHNLLDEKMLAEQLDAYYQNRGIQNN